MDTLWTLLKGTWVIFQVIMVFNILIVVHEWGHFLAARWRGLKVEKFQIWFGKCLWKKRINGVQYGLGTIPAGGFVALPQMAPMEMIEGTGEDGHQAEALPAVSPLDKIIVAIAGPLFSLGLAFLFAAVVWLVGYPKSVIESTVIGHIEPGYPAAESGLLAGDEIVAINGYQVKHFDGLLDSIIERVGMSKGETITIAYRRPGVEGIQEVECGFQTDGGGLTRRPGIRKIGIGPHMPPQVLSTLPDSPAARAGLQPGDRIVGANGEPIYSFIPISELVQKGGEIELEIERGDARLTVSVTPEAPLQPEGAPAILGIRWDRQFISSAFAHPTPLAQVTDSLRLIWRTISAVASPDTDVSVKHLSGPVGISTHYFNLLSAPEGWRLVFWFSVVLNVNLAILNMLPFPVLDGGHITLAIAEMIRGKPVNLRALEFVQTACALALISFMLFVTWFDGADALRNIAGSLGGEEEKAEIKFAPAGEAE